MIEITKVICLCPQGHVGDQGKYGVILLKRQHQLADVIFDYQQYRTDQVETLVDRVKMLTGKHLAKHVYIMLASGLSSKAIATAVEVAITLKDLEDIEAEIHVINPVGDGEEIDLT